MKKTTFGVSLNPKNQEDLDLMTLLQKSGDASRTIKQALRYEIESHRRPESMITEQEVDALRTELAWLRQNADRRGSPRLNGMIDRLDALVEQGLAAIDELEINVSERQL